MAYCDYKHCSVCDCKAFYDANIDWEYQDTGELKVLCKECAKTHELRIVNKEAAPEAERK